MKLVERETGLPLDLVIFINSFFQYEKLTNGNFYQAIALWFAKKEECKWRYGHISFWNTSRVTDMSGSFYGREYFDEDISGWDVRRVTDMSCMFYQASHFNGDISQWDVSRWLDVL